MNSNLPKPGKNATSFSKENQPTGKRGPKKVKDIKRLMVTFGKGLAPEALLNDEAVKHFLDTHNLEGTVNEVLVARLYSLALYGGDLKAIKLIIDLLNNTKGAGQGGLVIQFISPTPMPQEAPIDLSNDSWTVQPPVKEEEG